MMALRSEEPRVSRRHPGTRRRWSLAQLSERGSECGRRPGRAAPASEHPVARRYFGGTVCVRPDPQADERFQDLYNQGVNPEAFLYDPSSTPAQDADDALKRIREIDVPR